MVPEAVVIHRSPERVRMKIPGRRGDGDYFKRVRDVMVRQGGYPSVFVRPGSASLLVKGDVPDSATLAELGEVSGLYALRAEPDTRVPVSQFVVAPLKEVNSRVQRFTGGGLDLKNLVFIALLGAGLVQVLRGNLRLPPWYTAFWYSSGVFSKYLVDKTAERNDRVRA